MEDLHFSRWQNRKPLVEKNPKFSPPISSAEILISDLSGKISEKQS